MTPEETPSEPFEPDSRWVPLRAGWVTAVGAPSPQRLGRWRERGATDVLTLQRTDEMRPWIPERCEEHGLRWVHLAQPRDSLTRVGGRWCTRPP